MWAAWLPSCFRSLLAFLELEPPWRPVAVLAILILVHVVTNNFVERRLTGHAVGLNPLIVLVAWRSGACAGALSGWYWPCL